MTNNPPEQLSPNNQQGNQKTPDQDKSSAEGKSKTQNQTSGQEKSNGSNQDAQQEKSGDQQQGEKQDQQKQGEEQGDQQNQPADQATPDPKQQWQNTEKTIQDLHQKWNSLEPIVVKNGARPELTSEFEDQLNKLTKEIQAQKALPTLFAVNEVYQIIPDLEGLFETKVPPELHRLRYHINAILLQNKAQNWKSVASHLDKLKEEWDRLQPRLEDMEKDLISQFEFSISDLEKAIEEKDQSLTDIKAGIVLSNLRDLETKAGQQQENQGKDQGKGQEKGKDQGKTQEQK
jgi:hypothetical protein